MTQRPRRLVTPLVLFFFFVSCNGNIGSSSDPADAMRAGDASGDGAAGRQDADRAAGDSASGDSVMRDGGRADHDAGDPVVGGDALDGDTDTHGGILPVPFDVGASYGTTLYVAEDGSDSANDGSEGAPYRTIGHALRQATPGTRVIVETGSYPALGTHDQLHGSEAAPIAVHAQTGAVVDCEGTSQGGHFVDPAYLVIRGLTIRNAYPHGLNIDDGGSYDTPAHHVVLRDLTIAAAGDGGNNDCVKLSGVDDFFVLDSDISECNQGEIIDMVGCHRGFISGNHFHDTFANGVQTKGGSADVLIHGNRFVNIPARSINAGGSTGAAYFRPIDSEYEGARIQMVANIFERSGNAVLAFVGCDTCVFANNTIIEPHDYIARILEENVDAGPGHSGYFINNIVVFNTADLNSWTYVNVGPNTQPATYTFDWNLWFALDDASFSEPLYRGEVGPESAGLIQRDPLLVDRAGGDYHLEPDSPAIGSGGTVPRDAPADFDGRPYADPPSVGAFAGP